jgi:hypothetical protein
VTVDTVPSAFAAVAVGVQLDPVRAVACLIAHGVEHAIGFEQSCVTAWCINRGGDSCTDDAQR